MPLELSNQVHIITGASRGIGLATAKLVAQAGGLPVMIARSPEQVGAEAEALRSSGLKAEAYPLDITDADACKAMVRHVRDTHNRIDGLVNNAGTNMVANLLMCKESTWRPMFDVNVFAVIRLTQLCLKPMVRAKYGRIVNVSSVAAKLGAPYNTLYSASKAAVDGFTRSLAVEVAKLGITVNAVAPSQVNTQLMREGMAVRGKMAGKDADSVIGEIAEGNPMGRILEPKEVATTIRHLLSPNSGSVTGQSWNVCGGVALGL
ncbi:MAG: SDR family oxidoreductase [Nannocystaceae bacterium]|nr:SDR family oxidoreductase [Nannocystaceae bacterium]